MRRFTLGSSVDRKVVVLELAGPVLSVTQVARDGTKKRKEQTLAGESAARAAADKLARELLAHGYVEHAERAAAKAKSSPPPSPPKTKPAAPPPAAPELESNGVPAALFEDLEPVEEAVAPLARLAHPPADSHGDAPSPKKKKKKKSGKKKASNPDGLDKRVLAGIGAVILAGIAGIGFIVYDSFLKPPSILGAWGGSMVEHEISRSLTHTSYRLVLDEKKNASMTIGEEDPLTGTYSIKGKRLSLVLKDEDGYQMNREYDFKLGRETLDLIDPEDGKLLVQMIHIRNAPGVVAPGNAADTKNLVDANAGAFDPDAEKALAAVEYSAKDGAFKLRHPPGWTAETGARPDNTYSYVILTKGSSKIQAYADIQGSLMSGSDSAGEYEEGSEFAPVHKAHELYKRVAAEELSGYAEGRPDVFKGSALGEGRLSVFTASGGLFGGKLKGYHVTLLTRDRRVSILAYGPESEFETLRPTYLAVCRSFGR